MRIKSTAVLFLFALALVMGGATVAQEGDDHGHGDGHGHGEGHGEGHGDMTAEMEAWMKVAAPGSHHEHMAPLVGSWNVQSKVWMEPGADPIESHGKAEHELILGGRFIQTSFTGEFMGQPFFGMALDGYDNILGKHVGTWVDSMGTAIYNFIGTCSDEGKVRTMIAEYTDPSGEKQTMKAVTTIISNDKHTYASYGVTPDGEVKSFEITYTRR